jgi:hypothetical protein
VAVLARATPPPKSAARLLPVETTAAASSLPPRSERAAAGGPAGPVGVDWGDVWEYLVVAVRVAVVLRMALDDESAGVFSAAARALRTLAAPAAAEAAVWEAADASAAVSWPAPWRGALRRMGAAGTWEAPGELLSQV